MDYQSCDPKPTEFTAYAGLIVLAQLGTLKESFHITGLKTFYNRSGRTKYNYHSSRLFYFPLPFFFLFLLPFVAINVLFYYLFASQKSTLPMILTCRALPPIPLPFAPERVLSPVSLHCGTSNLYRIRCILFTEDSQDSPLLHMY